MQSTFWINFATVCYNLKIDMDQYYNWILISFQQPQNDNPKLNVWYKNNYSMYENVQSRLLLFRTKHEMYQICLIAIYNSTLIIGCMILFVTYLIKNKGTKGEFLLFWGVTRCKKLYLKSFKYICNIATKGETFDFYVTFRAMSFRLSKVLHTLYFHVLVLS